MPERQIRIVVEYDGSAYVGWQRQKNGPSVQEKVEAAVRVVTDEEAGVCASGRTAVRLRRLGGTSHHVALA